MLVVGVGPAQAELEYIPRRAKLNEFRAATELGLRVLFVGDATTAFVKGKWNLDYCKRVKLGAYRCPMEVLYRMTPGQHYQDECSAPVVLRRTGYRFLREESSCPDEWLPPPTSSR